jgi:predicted nucleic acid-binding protein
MNELVAAILKDHRLVLSSFVIEELKAVVQRKFKRRSADLDHFLTVLRQKNESKLNSTIDFAKIIKPL